MPSLESEPLSGPSRNFVRKRGQKRLIDRLTKFSIEDSASLDSIANNNLPLHSLKLEADEVHLWGFNLEQQSPDNLKLFLSDDEILRASRFHFTKDRNHFIAARGLLRKLLAAYLGVSPADLKVLYGEKGKPYVAAIPDISINFNLAHSHDLVIYAFSQGRELGVDVEYIRVNLADDQIAERFFSPREINALRALPFELRKQAFFNCWTRKEAYIKARGEGLSMPLDEFDVSLAPGEPAVLLNNYKDAGEVSRWGMQSVSVPEGYVAALVVEGHDWSLKSFGLDQLQELDDSPA